MGMKTKTVTMHELSDEEQKVMRNPEAVLLTTSLPVISPRKKVPSFRKYKSTHKKKKKIIPSFCYLTSHFFKHYINIRSQEKVYAISFLSFFYFHLIKIQMTKINHNKL